MFTNFQKLLDQSFIVGFLFPAVLALIAMAQIFPDSAALHPIITITEDDKLGKYTYIALMLYGTAIGLSMLNTVLYTILGGYGSPISKFGFMRRVQEHRRKKLLDKKCELDAAWKKGGSDTPPSGYVELQQRLTTEFPPAGSDVLPTRFGNAMSAFGMYPAQVYGVDGTPTWLRLASVISKDFAAELDGARARVNFLLNMFFILPLIAGAAAWQAVSKTCWPELVKAFNAGTVGDWRPSGLAYAAAAALIAMPFVYQFATVSARAWGDVVKAAFDCYLPALIKQLGYQPPKDEADRREFWTAINKMTVYWEPVPTGRWLLAPLPVPTLEVAKPAGAAFEAEAPPAEAEVTIDSTAGEPSGE